MFGINIELVDVEVFVIVCVVKYMYYINILMLNFIFYECFNEYFDNIL